MLPITLTTKVTGYNNHVDTVIFKVKNQVVIHSAFMINLINTDSNLKNKLSDPNVKNR